MNGIEIYLLLLLALTVAVVIKAIRSYRQKKKAIFQAQREMRVREYIRKDSKPRCVPSREFRGTRVGMNFNDPKRTS